MPIECLLSLQVPKKVIPILFFLPLLLILLLREYSLVYSGWLGFVATADWLCHLCYQPLCCFASEEIIQNLA